MHRHQLRAVAGWRARRSLTHATCRLPAVGNSDRIQESLDCPRGNDPAAGEACSRHSGALRPLRGHRGLESVGCIPAAAALRGNCSMTQPSLTALSSPIRVAALAFFCLRKVEILYWYRNKRNSQFRHRNTEVHHHD